MNDVLSLLIILVPTILFFLIIIWAILKGIIRGFRKTVILAIQALVAFIICIILFIILSNSERVDSGLVGLVNNFAGDGWLQNTMGVSESSEKLTEILYEFIPKQLDYGDGLALIIRDNGQYLLQLVLLVYRIILAFLMLIVYFVLIFVFYLIYIIFYPERRHKRKVNARYQEEQKRLEAMAEDEKEEPKVAPQAAAIEENQEEVNVDNTSESVQEDNASVMSANSSEEEVVVETAEMAEASGNVEAIEETPTDEEAVQAIEGEEEQSVNDYANIPPEEDITNILIEPNDPKKKPIRPYRKRRLLGSLIGGLRGLVAALVVISFIGSVFYIVAGVGDYDYSKELEITDEDISDAYQVYQAIDQYGTHGIFRVLNAIKTKNNMPYYLYACDLVFSGRIKDPARGINTRFNFADEIGAYTHFANKTVDLLMKYGKDKLMAAASNKDDILDAVLEIMAIEEFQADFDKLIDDFDGKTYFINFTLSLLDSIIAHMDQLSFAESNADTVDMISLLFKKNYLSDYIPEEKEIKDQLAINPAYSYTTRPFITASKLLTKNDTKSLLKVVVSSIDAMKIEDTVEKILAISENILPALKELSILNGSRKDELNGVYERLYVYLDNRFIQPALAESTGSDVVNVDTTEKLLAAGNGTTIDWTDELAELVACSGNAISIARSVYDPQKEVFDNVMNMFAETNASRADNIVKYDTILNSLSKSKILDVVMSSGGMTSLIKQSLQDVIPDMYIPELKYSDTVTSTGVERGETYILLSAFKGILLDDEARTSLVEFKNNSDSENSVTYIKNLLVALDKEQDDGSSILETTLDSRLLRSAVSGLISSYSVESFEIIVPNSIKELDSNNQIVNVIRKDELLNLTSTILKIMPDNSEFKLNDFIPKILENKDEFLDSSVISASIINMLTNGDSGIADMITIPDNYKNDATKDKLKEFASNNVWVENDELRKLFNALDKSFDIGSVNFDDEDATSKVIMDNIMKLNEIAEGEKTKLDLCYESVIMRTTITSKIKENSESGLVVPQSAYDTNDTYKQNGETQNVLAKDEISKIIQTCNLLELNLETAKITEITLKEEDIPELSESVIFRATITKNLKENNDLIVPNYALDSDGNLIEAELSQVLTIIEHNKNTIFTTNGDKINVENIEFDENKIKSIYVESLKEFSNSIVFSATIINKLATDTSYGLNVPKQLNDEAAKDELINNYEASTWYTTQELYQVFNSLDLVFTNTDPNATKSTLGNINEEAIKNKIFDEGFIGKCYTSIVLNNTISKNLYEELKDQNREDITNTQRVTLAATYSLNTTFEEVVYTESSVNDLLTALKSLGINKIDDINGADYTKKALDKSTNYNDLKKSTLLWDIVSKKIIDVANDTTNDIVSYADAYENYEGTEVPFIKVSEIEAIRTIYHSSGKEDINLETFGAADIKINDDTINAICDSYILRATVTDKLKKSTDDVTVPSDAYYNASLIYETELRDFLNVVKLLDVKLDKPEVNTIKLDQASNALYVKSIIFSATITQRLNDKDELVVPSDESTCTTNGYIVKSELTTVLNLLHTHREKIFGSANETIAIDNVTFNDNTIKTFKIEELKQFTDSTIFSATIINKLATDDSYGLSIPSELKTQSSKDALMAYNTNDWKTYNELTNMLDALDNVYKNTDPSEPKATLDDINESSIKNKIFDEGFIDKCYVSLVLNMTISTHLNNELEKQGRESVRENEMVYIKFEYSSLSNKYEDKVYKKDSVNKLLLALKELGITNINDIDGADYTNKALSESTDYDVLHESAIVWDILTNKIETTINDNVDLVNRDEAYENYKDSEVKFILVSELAAIRTVYNSGNATDLDNFTASNIVLNTDTKAAIVESYILRASVSVKIAGNTSITVPSDSFEDNEFIYSVDLADFLDVADKLNVNLSNPNVNSIELSADNNLVYAKSRIFRATLVTNINKQEKAIIPNESLEMNEENNVYFTSDEALLVLTKLTAHESTFFEVTDGKADITNFKFDNNNLTIAQCEDLIESITFYAIITKNITTITSLVIPDYHASLATNESIMAGFENNPWYKDQELANVFKGVEVFLGKNNALNTLDNTTIKTKFLQLTDDELTNLYSSVIMRLTVTDNVDSSIETQASSRADLRTAIKVHDDKYYAVNIAYVYYSKAEISNTITAIKALKVNNLNNFNESSVNYNTIISDNTVSIDSLCESNLIWDIVSEELRKIIENNSDIEDHDSAKETKYELSFYKDAEVEALRRFLIGCDISDASSFSIANVTYNDNIIYSVNNSLIIRKTITKNITTNDTLIVTKGVYDSANQTIKATDINALLRGIFSISGAHLDVFDLAALNVNELDKEKISDSTILRASIMGVIGDVYIEKSTDYYAEDTRYDSDVKALVLTKNETINLIDGLNALGKETFDSSVTFDQLLELDEAKLLTVTNSAIMHFAASDVIITGFNYGGHYTYSDYRTTNSGYTFEDNTSVEFVSAGYGLYKMPDAETINVVKTGDNTNATKQLIAKKVLVAFVCDFNDVYINN